MNKKLLSKLTVLGVGASVIAPIATVVSCGDEEIKNVGFVVTPDGTIDDGFFAPMWKAVETTAKEKSVKALSQEVTKKEDSATIDAVDTLVEAGSKVIFQPGFMNSATILDNAIKHPGTKFVGVSFTKYVSAAKAFTAKDEDITPNLGKFDGASNLGLIHFKTQEQGFKAGYITAATYLEKESTASEIVYSVVSSKAYQDTTALLDGFIAGVEALAKEKSKTTKLVQPTASGFFTNVTVDNKAAFDTTNKTALDKMKADGAKFIFAGDPNSVATFASDASILLATDGGDYGKTYSNVVIATDKNWNSIFKTATEVALGDENKFKTDYHDKMHLSTFDNGELIIAPTRHFKAELDTKSTEVLKTWEAALTADAANIYTKKDAKSTETEAGTSKGLSWYADLK